MHGAQMLLLHSLLLHILLMYALPSEDSRVFPPPRDVLSNDVISIDMFVRTNYTFRGRLTEILIPSLRYTIQTDPHLNITLRIVLDCSDDDKKLGAILQQLWPYPIVHYAEPLGRIEESFFGSMRSPGYQYQAFSYLFADRFVKSDIVIMVDDDCAFRLPITRRSLFKDGKLIMKYEEGSSIHTRFESGALAIGVPYLGSGMAPFPMVYWTKDLANMRAYIEDKHHMKITDSVSTLTRSLAGQVPLFQSNTFCFFTAMFHYTWHSQRDNYSFRSYRSDPHVVIAEHVGKSTSATLRSGLKYYIQWQAMALAASYGAALLVQAERGTLLKREINVATGTRHIEQTQADTSTSVKDSKIIKCRSSWELEYHAKNCSVPLLETTGKDCTMSNVLTYHHKSCKAGDSSKLVRRLPSLSVIRCIATGERIVVVQDRSKSAKRNRATNMVNTSPLWVVHGLHWPCPKKFSNCPDSYRQKVTLSVNASIHAFEQQGIKFCPSNEDDPHVSFPSWYAAEVDKRIRSSRTAPVPATPCVPINVTNSLPFPKKLYNFSAEDVSDIYNGRKTLSAMYNRLVR